MKKKRDALDTAVMTAFEKNKQMMKEKKTGKTRDINDIINILSIKEFLHKKWKTYFRDLHQLNIHFLPTNKRHPKTENFLSNQEFLLMFLPEPIFHLFHIRYTPTRSPHYVYMNHYYGDVRWQNHSMI